jgi:hypothetical protein
MVGRGNVTCTGFMNNFGRVYTLTMEEACVVRFLMFDGRFGNDVIKVPPKRTPTLREVLELHSKSAK